MEYCEGGSLLDLLRERGPLPEPSAQHILRQLVEALGYMQEVHNMVHRDLKPAVAYPIPDGRMD
jgi:serine/threonine protein kinase